MIHKLLKVILRLKILSNDYSIQDEIDRYYLNFNLDPDVNEFDNYKVSNSRARATRVLSFCSNYIKNGGLKYREFAEMIIEIIKSDPGKDDDKLIG